MALEAETRSYKYFNTTQIHEVSRLCQIYYCELKINSFKRHNGTHSVKTNRCVKVLSPNTLKVGYVLFIVEQRSRV